MIVLPPINAVDLQKAYKRMISRPAVKALCAIDDRYVLLKLKDGTYKLPGGGVNIEEDELAALSRELQEECGIPELKNIRLAFHINEYKPDRFDGSCVFHIMTNVYTCKATEMLPAQQLDEYEKQLGMRPVLEEVQGLPGLFQGEQHEWSERDRQIIQAFISHDL